MQGGSEVGAADELPVLKALLGISDAVSRAHYFDEVLEVIAEQAMVALDAASLSLCRWEHDRAALRVLLNVGDLQPPVKRWPQDEFYPVAADSNINRLLSQGISYTFTIRDADCPPETRRILTSVGKECELAVPVMVGDSTWGSIWATGSSGRRFTEGDVQLLQAIAAHTAIAIGRSELFSTVWRYAFEDPLTGIANRRAIDQHLADIDWATEYPVALLCDLDGFKRINDRDGHPAGDQLLREIARVLERLTRGIEGSVAARLGGDEFCVLLPDATLGSAQVFAIDATTSIRDSVGSEVTVSWGAAACGPGTAGGDDLLAAADAALREAKRQGPARFSTGVATSAVQGGIDRRDGDVGGAGSAERLTAVVVKILGEQPDLTVPKALEFLALQAQQVFGTAAWALSQCIDDHGALRSIRSADCVYREESGLSVMTELGPGTYDLVEYPASARALRQGSTFVAAIGLEGSDPAETALLSKLGYHAVLGVGVPAGERCYLLELYSRDGHQHLVDIAPLVQVLTVYCATRLSGNRPPHHPA